MNKKNNWAERDTVGRQTPSSTFQNSSLGDETHTLDGVISQQIDVGREAWDRLEAPMRGHPSADSQRPTEEVDAPGGRPLAGRAMPPAESGWLGQRR
jgi:hypothetical protein